MVYMGKPFLLSSFLVDVIHDLLLIVKGLISWQRRGINDSTATISYAKQNRCHDFSSQSFIELCGVHRPRRTPG